MKPINTKLRSRGTYYPKRMPANGVDMVFNPGRPYGHVVSLLQPNEVERKIARRRNLSGQYGADALADVVWLGGGTTAQGGHPRTVRQVGKLKVHISPQRLLADAAKAHALIEAGGS